MIDEENFNLDGFSVDINASRGESEITIPLREINIQEVFMNYEYWNRESKFLSTDNYNNSDFRKIVAMGEDAVPGILEIINDHPDPIVHALDLIYPDIMKYEGYVSLEDVCRTWIITLTVLGKR